MDDELRSNFVVNSISDSGGRIFPKSAPEIKKAIDWKNSGGKLAQLALTTNRREASSAESPTIYIDVTNSDYSKPEEAKRRAVSALESGKHYVSANKVALSSYFSEILDLAKSRGLKVGMGATICGGRHAISVARNIPRDEIVRARAVLNASTTLILSELENNPDLSFEEACKNAAQAGVLESDWSIDLDGIDAAAKTSILSNVLFPESRVSLKSIPRKGIRDEEALKMIRSQRSKGGETPDRVRLVSEISREDTFVEPKLVSKDSPLAVGGRFNCVLFETRTLGEISVRNFGAGVALTVSVIVSDLKEISTAILA